jgi:hypothetical protein
MPVDFESAEIPSSVRMFRPLVYQNGDLVCVILGPDPEVGIVGRGETKEEALKDWDEQLRDRLKYHTDDDEIARYICETMNTSLKFIN